VIKVETRGLDELASGLRELERQLVALGANEGRKVLTRAARKAFRPVLEAAIAKVPVDTGLTRDNIKIRVEKPKGGEAVVKVGLRIVRAKGGRERADGTKATSPHWRWHFIEGGVPAHGIAARPFLRPALDANAEAVVGTLREQLGKEIDRVLKKRAKAAAKGAKK
jgi:HK97 gp10 family phage protein